MPAVRNGHGLWIAWNSFSEIEAISADLD